MKLVTFNLRCESKCDGNNAFHHRRGFVIDRLETEKPDVIGFQEITPAMNEYLRTHLREYTLVGCGREANYQGEHNPVAFLSDKYELIGLDVSWLSDTPYAPGSRFEKQSLCPRIITHTILRPIGEGKPFHVYNTHLDHEFDEARVLGAKRLLEKLKEDQKTHPFPLALTGDFNAYPDSEAIRLLREDEFGLTERTEGLGTTWHDYGRGNEPQIDYIFTRGMKAEGAAELWTQNLNGIYLSDHYPIAVELTREDGETL